MKPSACVWVIWAALNAALPLHARAQPNVHEQIRLTIVGSAWAESLASDLSARALEMELETETRIVEGTTANDVLAEARVGRYFARVWVDASDARTVRVWVVDRLGARLLMRQVATTGRLDVVTAEEVMEIVLGALEALSRGGEIGVSLAPPPPPPTRAIAALALELRALDGLERPLPAVGLRVGARHRNDRWRFSAALVGTYVGDVVRSTPHVTLTLSRVHLGVLASVGWWALGPIAIVGGLGAGADLVVPIGRSGQEPALLDDLPLRALFVGRAFIGATIELDDALEIEASFGADLDLSDERYFVAAGEAELEVFDPSTVRPFAALGLTLRL